MSLSSGLDAGSFAGTGGVDPGGASACPPPGLIQTSLAVPLRRWPRGSCVSQQLCLSARCRPPYPPLASGSSWNHSAPSGVPVPSWMWKLRLKGAEHFPGAPPSGLRLSLSVGRSLLLNPAFSFRKESLTALGWLCSPLTGLQGLWRGKGRKQLFPLSGPRFTQSGDDNTFLAGWIWAGGWLRSPQHRAWHRSARCLPSETALSLLALDPWESQPLPPCPPAPAAENLPRQV